MTPTKILLTLSFLIGSIIIVNAANHIWLGTAGDGDWNNPNNWDLTAVPGIVDGAIFDGNKGTPAGPLTINSNTTVNVGRIVVRNNANIIFTITELNTFGTMVPQGDGDFPSIIARVDAQLTFASGTYNLKGRSSLSAFSNSALIIEQGVIINCIHSANRANGTGIGLTIGNDSPTRGTLINRGIINIFEGFADGISISESAPVSEITNERGAKIIVGSGQFSDAMVGRSAVLINGVFTNDGTLIVDGWFRSGVKLIGTGLLTNNACGVISTTAVSLKRAYEVMPSNGSTPQEVNTGIFIKAVPTCNNTTTSYLVTGPAGEPLNFKIDNGPSQTLALNGLEQALTLGPLPVGSLITFAPRSACGNACPATAEVKQNQQLPNPTFTVTDPAPACVGMTVNISNSVSSLNPANELLTFHTNEEGALSGLNPITGTALTAISTSQKVYVRYEIENTGCFTTDEINVTIGAAPNLVITNPPATCSGGIDLTAAAITAGSDAGTKTYFSDANLTTAVPNPNAVGSGTYYIQLTTAAGCSTSKMVTINLASPPNLQITPPSASCATSRIDLTAAAITAGSEAGTKEYFEDAALTTPIANPSEVVAGTYFIRLTNSSGCSNSKAVTITSNAPTSLFITNPTPICAPNTIDLTLDAITSGSEAGTKNYFEDANLTTIVSNPNAVESGTYFIQLTSGITGCSSVQSVNVTINDLPNLAITDPAVCFPDRVNLTDVNITTGSEAGNFTYFEDAALSSPVVNPNEVESGTYYIQLTNPTTGCSNSKPVSATINTLPNLTVSNPATVCSPNVVDITNPAITTGSDVGNLDYFSDAALSIPVTTPNGIGAGNYYIKLSDPNTGCAASETVTVDVATPPTLQIATTTAPCATSRIDLTADAVTQGSDAGVKTYFLDVNLTTPIDNPNDVLPGTYYIQLTSPIGCRSTQEVAISIDAPNSLNITNPAAVCSPNMVDLTLDAITAGSDNGAKEYFEDSNLTTPVSNPNAVGAGTYYVQLTSDATGCPSVQPVTVTVNTLPTIAITDPATCFPNKVNLTDVAITTGSEAGNFTYFEDAALSSSIVNPNEVETGTYYIQLTNPTTGCSDSKPVSATINALPNLTITDPATVCSPNVVDISNPSITGGSEMGNLDYFSDAGLSSPIANPNGVVAGTYFIRLTDTNTGCSASESVTADIATPPTLQIAPTTAPCATSRIDLTADAITQGSDTGVKTYFLDANLTTPIDNPNDVLPGTYYIQLTSPIGCTSSQEVGISVDAPNSLTITNPDAVCVPNMVDITLDAITAGSDNGAKTYFEDSNLTTPVSNPNAVGAGTYYIQLMSDVTGCPSIQPVVVTVNDLPNIIITDPTSCFPDKIDLTSTTITTGSEVGNLEYFEDAALNTSITNPNEVETGMYFIQLTNPSTGCSDSKPVSATINALPNLTVSDPATVCTPNMVDITDAAVTVGSDMGNLDYFSDAALTTALANPNEVGIGTYFIKLTDTITGCSTSESVNTDIATPPTLQIADPTVACITSAIDLTVDSITLGSDTGTKNYFLDENLTTPIDNPNEVLPGTYYIQLTSPIGCISAEEVSILVDAPNSLLITNPDPVCAPNVVDITLDEITTGSDNGPKTYFEDSNLTRPISNPSALGGGTYYIQLLSDVTGCPSIQAVEVTVNDLPNLAIANPSACTPNTIDLTNVDITTGSEVGNFEYFEDADLTIPLNNPNGVETGTYFIKLTSSITGCINSASVDATINDLPTLAITNPTEVCVPNTVDITTTEITTGSEVGDLEYFEDAALTTPINTPSGVGEGTYFIKLISEATGCINSGEVRTTVNDLPTLAITNPADICVPNTLDLTNTDLTIGSDVGDLAYFEDAALTIPITNPDAVDAGVYSIQLTSSTTGCANSAEVRVTVNELPNLMITDPESVCVPNTIDLTESIVTQGSDIGTLTYFEDENLTIPLNTPEAVTTGAFYIELRNNTTGCAIAKPVSIKANDAPNLVVNNPDAVCTPNTVDITQANLTTGSDMGTLSYFDDPNLTIPLINPESVGAGVYYVKLESANTGCPNLAPITVIVNDLPTLQITNPAPVCDPETISLRPTNITEGSDEGTLRYFSDAALNKPLDQPNGVGVGTYYIELTSAETGCVNSAAVTTTSNLPPAVNILPIDRICDDETTAIDAALDIDVTANLSVNYFRDITLTEVEDVPSSVGVGTFYVQVEDLDTGCETVEPIEVLPTLNQPIALIENPSSITCRNESVQLDASNSSQGADIVYNWESLDGHAIDQTNPIEPIIGAIGDYRLRVTNQDNGCAAQAIVTILIDTISPIASINAPDAINCETGTATIDGSASSNGSHFSYNWTTSDGNIIAGLNTISSTVDAAGIYELEVLNTENGCSGNTTISINDMRPNSVDFELIPPPCFDENGELNIGEIEGGTAPYTYSVGNTFSDNTTFSLAANNYNLIVKDANDCELVTPIEIIAPAALSVNLGNQIDIDLGDSVTLAPVLNIPTSEVAEAQWSPAEGLSCADCLNPTVQGTRSQQYTLEIMSQNGCIADSKVTLRVDKTVDIFVPNVFKPFNSQAGNDRITIYAKNGIIRTIKSFEIINRWGVPVFQRQNFAPNDPALGWDGYMNNRKLGNGTFLYRSIIEMANGEEIVLAGDFTLIR